ncbi:palmitoleoyl-protein carboxylesterase notum1-like isoform X2 [Centruroides sculpturatus]|nr:palmitoleoyl-protein carboxylesterase notum1-like isoform X2 [Centruroides sculpturatus]XP_023238204.1 palmitoleoyl-protein carboxylesterase notum1-like isoform X2 [Centruroides sculpturatus]XP_023238205.1 palmitoleoyl-protein carboxylesterase notum1-like isoform X2 [Centruroides sculpturatus]XP_023238206.1 palmitoleoyl-protein carboxylesterase notum1-like isoform X2 [Centruroides sculpturatus]
MPLIPFVFAVLFGVSRTSVIPSQSGSNLTPENFKRILGPEVLSNLQNLAKLGNPENTLEVIHVLTQALQECVSRETPSMRRMYFSNRTVVCNDGSPAGYYIRKSHGSKRWIVFLEGGWYCFDWKSCENRWQRMRNLMSSNTWPENRNVGGILSADPEENPHWWNANHVFVPYCSSDSWSGASSAKEKGEFSFLGSIIVVEVIKELIKMGLYNAERLLLAGSSAGGTGVLVNLDRIADFLNEQGSRVKVYGLADSGWFLDNDPYESVECIEAHTCAPVEAIKQGIRLWNGQVPTRCKALYNPTDVWRCYFGYRIYPTLKAPLFVFQWLFDEAQMTADNVGAPVSKAQWDYIHHMGNELRSSLQNVTAVFAPSCISHIVLTKRDWRYVKINKNTLPEAIQCWEILEEERSNREKNEDEKENSTSQFAAAMLADMPYTQTLHIETTSSTEITSTDNIISREERRKLRRKERKRRRQNKNKKRKNKNRHSDSKKRQKRTVSFENNHSALALHDNYEACTQWFMDECSWPQCNRDCPRLHNPFTGEEMDFIELLKSFGLDMGSVANALGIDLTTLNEMDHDTLLQLLTQQTN